MNTADAHTRAAILIGIMAAALALTEFAAKDAQTGYLTNHIAASDTWAQYQAKSVRRAIFTAEAEVLGSLSTSADAAIKKRIADALANADRMHSEPGADGMEQLSEKAHEQEHVRDHQMHRTHGIRDSKWRAANRHRAGFHLRGHQPADLHDHQRCAWGLLRDFTLTARWLFLIVNG
jgi:hypothetical protein